MKIFSCFPCAGFLDTEYRYFLGTGIQTDLEEQSYSMNTMYAPKVLKTALKNMPVNKTLIKPVKLNISAGFITVSTMQQQSSHSFVSVFNQEKQNIK